MEEVKQRIKEHEGFRDTVYSDSLGFATVGFGHLLLPTDDFVEGVVYSKENLENLFELDFNTALQSADDLLQGLAVNHIVRGVICEMCFQLGKPRVMKFKKMWEGIKAGDWNKSADEMIDSNWYKQTKSRCESLASLMTNCNK